MRVKFIYLFFFLTILGFVWVQLDKKLFFVGKSIFKYYNILPFQIQPYFRNSFEGGFALNYNDGFSIVSPNMKIEDCNLEIDTIIKINKYSIYNGKVIVEIVTANNNNCFIEIVKCEFVNTEKQCLSFKITDINTNQIKNWIEIRNDSLANTELFRNIIFLLIVVIVIALLYSTGAFFVKRQVI